MSKEWKIWGILKSVFFVCIILVGPSCMAGTKCDVTVYYLPLELEFYTPPTVDYIKENGKIIEGRDLLSICNLIENIFKLKGESNLQGENKRLRILIVDRNTNKNIFITSSKKIVMDEKLYEVSEKIVDSALAEIIKKNKQR